MTAAILSPHLDDAVLSCWHLLAGDDDVRVINVFAGVPLEGRPPGWWDRLTGATDSAARMRERLIEDRRALAVAGRTPINLGLLDEQYRRSEPPLARLVAAVARRLAPGARVYAPAGLGDHADHKHVRAVALALRSAGFEAALYADLPHASQHGWPAWVTGRRSGAAPDLAAAVWQRTLGSTGMAQEALRPTVHLLDGAAHARKLEALRAYGTQLTGLAALAARALEDPEILGYEVVWTVSARRSAPAPAGPRAAPRRRLRR